MDSDNTKDQVSRRGFLGASSGTLAAATGALIAGGAAAQEQTRSVRRANDRSATDPGPTNGPQDAQNPDSTWPPSTDSKSLVRTFKYPFSFANKRPYEGGGSGEGALR